MKKLASMILILTFCMAIVGCGNNKTIDGYTYGTYGLINEGDKKNPEIEYQLIILNIIVSCILVKTIIVPIYII